MHTHQAFMQEIPWRLWVSISSHVTLPCHGFQASLKWAAIVFPTFGPPQRVYWVFPLSNVCNAIIYPCLIVPRGCRGSKFLQNQIVEDNDHILEFERMRLARLQLTRKPPGNQAYVADSMGRLKISEGDNLTRFFFWFTVSLLFTVHVLLDRLDFSSAECLHYLMDVLNNGSTAGDKNRPSDTNYDQDRYLLNMHRIIVILSFSWFTVLDSRC